ncbi:MAG: ATP-dependent DNA helicase DinG [Thermobacillus sp. ZCTH02-B1]|uniref:ATP-dependent DNA helicase DinG n=1 Tax=Thermobacillus sp. ZCTH02-B1 TaxID=1858795 RepID=UPI000B57A029|nr:ATP-dependent DNA helicase DinG [Thermobacillus sp. ZCTH02-B1]OUM96750.1 MAG: ATP-dependent DNA helicase DinG [Thermobacillus sp. ZCTH02-B1]
MKFAVLDLETTGNHSDTDDIIQIGIVLLDEECGVTGSYASYVRPRVPVPAFITELTGITDEDVRDAPEPEDVMAEVIPLISDAVLVAHNAGFDVGFLNDTLDRCGYLPFTGRVLDTLQLLRILYPTQPSYQLGAVTEAFGIEHERHHRADSDAMATALVFRACMKKLRNLPLLTLERMAAQLGDGDDLGWIVHDALERRRRQKAIDTDAWRYHRGFALRVGEWTEEEPPRLHDPDAAERLRNTDFETFLAETLERLREHVPDYEPRDAQVRMIREVHDALESGRHLMIEAGTGTGKSLGYLIPALYYGIRHDEKIVVSTHTINLQEQIRERDVPLLAKVLPVPFKASVFKGRSNYLCLRKFEGKLAARDYFAPSDDRLTTAQMLVWLSETEHGDQEELNFGGRGAEYWQTVASDADSCLNRACPWFRHCFYHRAKQEASHADLVITNHSLLFTDIRAEYRLLPAYDHLIVDEAHHLEEAAGKHLGAQISYNSGMHPLIRLCKDARSGLIFQLRQKIADTGHARAEGWIETIDGTVPTFGELRLQWDELFELLYRLAQPGADDDGQGVLRVRGDRPPAEWEAVRSAEANVFASISEIVRAYDRLMAELREHCDDAGVEAAAADIAGRVKDLARVRDELRRFVRLEEHGTVYWIETNAFLKFRSVHLFAVPADVSGLLKQYFFDAKRSVILTSATLSVHQSFEYATEQLGLTGFEEDGRLQTVQLPSPFNYRDQALVVIPRNLPPIRGANADPAFLAALVDSLADVARETSGRMLVLFTSYKMLKQVYEPLKERLSEAGISVIAQGVDGGGRTKLVRRFRQSQASVLLGTSSFWEGVDLPGEMLTCLAIVRLPFSPPNHPLLEAKSEQLAAEKKNPFMKLSIPQAVIRFKQGFGRLVRTARDRGIVILYDTRVIDTSYGKYFLHSLPGPRIETMNVERIVPRIREWLGETGAKQGGSA